MRAFRNRFSLKENFRNQIFSPFSHKLFRLTLEFIENLNFQNHQASLHSYIFNFNIEQLAFPTPPCKNKHSYSIQSLRPHVKPKFQYFLNQHSNIYLEKEERQAFRTRKHYIQISFWMILLVFS